MKDYQTLTTKVDQDVLRVTLNRPATRNAVSREMMLELIDVADHLRGAPDISYVVTSHEGPVFSSGADGKEMREILSAEDPERSGRLNELQRMGQELIAKLESLDQIHVAAINGSCYGAGTAIALTADFRIMSQDAVIAFPEAAAGTFLTWGCTPRLTATVGALRAKEFILLHREVDADEAFRHNLVTSVHPTAEVDEAVELVLAEMRKLGPLAISYTKKLVNASSSTPGAVLQAVEPDLVVQLAVSGQLAEGFAKVGR